MHRSQIGGFIIDCQVDGLEGATGFWSRALGLEARRHDDPEEAHYVELLSRPEEIYVELQKVDHPSRVHLDIETDDIEAEVRRLQALGAKRIAAVREWVVMEAPTGQRFCVVPVVRANFEERANIWD